MTSAAVAELTGARLSFGDRVLWDRLDLTVRRGEFIAVLGPNGTGKTSLLKVLLRQQLLTAGRMTTTGAIGYVPQHRSLDTGLTLRGRDLVGLMEVEVDHGHPNLGVRTARAQQRGDRYSQK